MLFNKKFEVVEIRGKVIITHYLNGNPKDVKKTIEMFKSESKNWIMRNRNKMIVWA